MAEPVVVARISTDDFSGLDQLDEAIEKFQPGDLGQINLPLDPEIAVGEERQSFESDTSQLNNELLSSGLQPWPGETRIAELDWKNRSVRLLFRTAGTVTRRGDIQLTPAVDPYYGMDYGIFANVVRMTATRMGGQAAMRTLATSTGRTLRPVGARASLATQRRAIQTARASYKQGLRRGRFTFTLPSLRLLVGGGALIFFALAPGKFIELLKWVGSKVGEAAKDAAKAAADAAKDALGGIGQALGEGVGKIGLVAIGGVLVVGGVYFFMRRK